jgi:uncharacterized protein
VLLWVDIENQPQVQYLLPIVDAWRKQGMEAIVTARDYGATFESLHSRGAAFHAVGASYGASKRAKVLGVLKRSRQLTSLLKHNCVPDRLVCASRAGALAARRLRIPSFVISDYEYANLTFFRWAGSTILFPDVIDPSVFQRGGFSGDRLVSFQGLKEDITFAGIDIESVEPASFADHQTNGLARVLVRPPAEESHYYTPHSRSLYLEVLAHIARDERAVVVLSPRYPRQADDLNGLSPANPPIVLSHPVPFLALLKAVDLVVCSGGTMLREAGYLGIPAFGIFKSRVGGVDRYLESIGRATLLTSDQELSRFEIKKASGLTPLKGNPHLVDELVEIVAQSGRANTAFRSRARS